MSEKINPNGLKWADWQAESGGVMAMVAVGEDGDGGAKGMVVESEDHLRQLEAEGGFEIRVMRTVDIPGAEVLEQVVW